MSEKFSKEWIAGWKKALSEQGSLDHTETNFLDALTEIEQLQGYALKLLADDTRTWYCSECGELFTGTFNGVQLVAEQDMKITCPKCEEVTARPLSFILRDENASLRALVGEFDEELSYWTDKVRRLSPDEFAAVSVLHARAEEVVK